MPPNTSMKAGLHHKILGGHVTDKKTFFFFQKANTNMHIENNLSNKKSQNCAKAAIVFVFIHSK